MDAKLARALVEAGQDAGLEIEMREDYSGRGMYGATTAALIAPGMAEVIKAVAELMRQASREGIDCPGSPGEFADLIMGEEFREDSMGRDEVVIY